MKRQILAGLMMVSLIGAPTLVGCNREISHEKTVKQGPNGTTVKEKTVTENPNGTVNETQTKETHNP